MTSAEFAKAVDKTIFPGLQGGPLMHVIAGKAVTFGEALQPDYRAYTKQVIENAMTMSDVFVERGMKVISGGTDTHLLLLDVDSIGMSGKQAEKALEKVGITVNKNTIPGDPRPPTQASGIRIGSPAVTTRGFGVDDSRWVANLIADVLQQPDDEALIERAQEEVLSVSGRYPLPGLPG
jgi:glycine hydroxymethyltransferase